MNKINQETVDWLEYALKIKISDFGKEVATILDCLAYGIYHLKACVYNHKRTDWTNNRVITVVTNSELSTYDYNELTHLVVLAHDFAIRISIRAVAPNYFEMQFSKRVRGDGITSSHPAIEDAIHKIRQDLSIRLVGEKEHEEAK